MDAAHGPLLPKDAAALRVEVIPERNERGRAEEKVACRQRDVLSEGIARRRGPDRAVVAYADGSRREDGVADDGRNGGLAVVAES